MGLAHTLCSLVRAQEGEQAVTQLIAHPPGGENDPDDRAMHVPPEGYVEDADGNATGPDGQPGQPGEGAFYAPEAPHAGAGASPARDPLCLAGIICRCFFFAAWLDIEDL